MDSAVTIAIITVGGTFLSSILTGIVVGNKTIYRIDQLEKKVDKHNCLVERMVVVEESTKSAHHRLDELREEVVK